MTANTSLRVPVTTLIAAVEGKIAQMEAVQGTAEKKHQEALKVYRALVVEYHTAMAKAAKSATIEELENSDSYGRRTFGHEIEAPSVPRREEAIARDYNSRTGNWVSRLDKAKADLGVLKATSDETISVPVGGGQWTNYLS